MSSDGPSRCFLLKLGPFVYRVNSKIPAVLSGVRTLYPDKVTPEDNDLFVDFDLQIDLPRGVRRWLFPQSIFKIDQSSPFRPLPKSEALALLEWGMNWCVGAFMNRYVVVHAAVLERNGKYLIAPAASGSGKSTLAAGLMFSGWNLISDELCIIDPNTLKIIPTERAISLKNDSIKLISQRYAESVLSDRIVGTKKGDISFVKPLPILGSVMASVPGIVVMPKYQASAQPGVESLSKGRAMMALIDNAFNYSITGEAGFKTVAAVVRNSQAYAISYQNLDQAVDYCDQLAQRSGF